MTWAQSPTFSAAPHAFPAYSESGERLANPWTGGLNSAQLGRAEVNGDGREDVVLYDRYARQAHAFLATDSGYIWSVEASTALARVVESWAQWADVDGDGRADLFTAHPSGMRVYRNTLSPTGGVTWEPLITAWGAVFLQADSELGRLNIQMNRSDVPGIADADGDGDLDIWTFSFSTGLRMNYYENTSVDSTGVSGALTFRRVSAFWGGLSDCGCGATTVDSVDCRPLAGEHLGGKAIFVLPEPSAGVVYGEEECVVPAWISNVGSPRQPDLAVAQTTDSLQGYQLLPFAAGYALGPDSWVFSTNLSEDAARTVDFANTLHQYRQEAGQWQLQSTDWLQSGMVDVGNEAVPAWADLDQDGDWDMLLAQGGAGPALQVWENVGSAQAPAFQAATTYSPNLELRHWQVWAVDLDADGVREVIMAGRTPGAVNFTVYYATPAPDGTLGPWQPWALPLTNSEHAALGDVDGDGALDALISTPSGRIRRLENEGTGLAPEWVEREAAYLGLDSEVNRLLPRITLADLDQDGKQDLLITSQTGPAEWVPDIARGDNQSPERLRTTAGGQLLFPRFSTLSALPVALGQPAYLAAGLAGGGVQWFRPQARSAPTAPEWRIYPNPTQGEFTIRSSQPATGQLYSLQGQRIWKGAVPEQVPLTLSLLQAARGPYFLRLTFADGTAETRMVYRLP